MLFVIDDSNHVEEAEVVTAEEKNEDEVGKKFKISLQILRQILSPPKLEWEFMLQDVLLNYSSSHESKYFPRNSHCEYQILKIFQKWLHALLATLH